MIAQLISIGNELTSGQTVDTNSAWLARRLNESGVTCVRHITVADALEPISHAFRDAGARGDLVIATGGLGPTPDDLTREALANALGVALALHEPSLSAIAAYFERRGRPMHSGNRAQAMLPVGAEAMENPVGTAPGIRARMQRAQIFCLPGVPHEMRTMFDMHVRPAVDAVSIGATVNHTLRTVGMSESEVGERLKDLMRRDRNPTIGTSADELIISIRIVATADTRAAADALLRDDVAEVHQRLGDVIYGENDDSLADAVARLLTERGLTVSTAESCTGGLIAKNLTDVGGASAYFKRGFITYTNEAKQELLGVSEDDLRAHGAVSEPVARAMAEGCRRYSGADVAISCTGIAGPTGGTAEKPVGLVYVGLATPDETIVKRLLLGDTLTRMQVRGRTAVSALNLLRLTLLGRAKGE